MTPLAALLLPGIDGQAFGAGFGLGTIATALFWGALAGLTLLRSLLTDAAE